MRPTLVVFASPSFDLRSCFVNRFKPVRVQAFVPQRSVEGFDEAVVRGLAGATEIDSDFVVICPQIEQTTGKLAAVVDEHAYWCTSNSGNQHRSFRYFSKPDSAVE